MGTKKNRLWNLVSKIPSRTDKLETIFEKSHRSTQILKIVGVTPQLDQIFKPTSIVFFCGLITDFGTPKQSILAHPQILIIFGIWNTEISHRRNSLLKSCRKNPSWKHITELWREIIIRNLNSESSLIKNFWSPNNVM